MAYDGYRNPDVNMWWLDEEEEDCPEKKCPECNRVWGPSQYDCCGKVLSLRREG